MTALDPRSTRHDTLATTAIVPSDAVRQLGSQGSGGRFE
jgi:hypothetical protein